MTSSHPIPTQPPPPTQTRYVQPPRPTILPNLVETTPFHPAGALPAGLQVNIYRMNQPVLGEVVGYPEVREVLKDQVWQPHYIGWVDIDQKYLDAVNGVISSYDWRIERGETSEYGNQRFILYHGEKIVLDNLTYFFPVLVNESRTDFMLDIETDNYQWKQVRKDGVINPRGNVPDTYVQDYWPDAMPRFLGDDIVTATMEFDHGEHFPWVRVYKNGGMIYQTKSTVTHVRPPLVGLWTYGQHWALEVLEAVTIDGESVNEKFGYQKSFQFAWFGGKPLYLFEKDGQIWINRDGEEILLPGGSVPHYNCCGNVVLNPRISEYVLDFSWPTASNGITLRRNGHTKD